MKKKVYLLRTKLYDLFHLKITVMSLQMFELINAGGIHLNEDVRQKKICGFQITQRQRTSEKHKMRQN